MPKPKRVKRPDTSPYVHQDKKKDINIKLDCRVPWTAKQLEFFRLAQDKNTKLIFLVGPSGTSKSLVSVFSALTALSEKKVSDIIYLRSIVESSNNKMGFLPGSLDQKLDPYLEPLLDKVDECVSTETKKLLLENGLILGRPINFLRGCQFAGKYVIFDEIQNINMKEAVTFLTRIGEFSKVIACGDTMQSDINGQSALPILLNIFDSEESREQGIHIFRFGKEDIVRSKLVAHIVDVIEKYMDR